MDARVDDRVALVTGASRGIGEAVAAELLASGAKWIGAHPGGDCETTLEDTWFRLRLDLP